MSALPVTLLACEREDSLALLTVALPDGQQLSALSTTAVATEPGTPLLARVKAAEIALARPPLGAISLRNRIASRVTAIEAGRLLARVRLAGDGFDLAALITRAAVEELALREGDNVLALIKAHDLALFAAESPDDAA